MSVYIVTGKLGQGKTLAAVHRIREYILRGNAVATNLNLFTEHGLPAKLKHKKIIRIPDKPSIDDLTALGRGAPTNEYDESKFGCLVLDECGTWFNSRNWNDKSRKPVIDWFLHSRKLGWDVYLVIQDISMLDNQAREALAEYTVFTRRLDKIRIPIMTALFKMLFKVNVRLPRLHVGVVKYGDNRTMPTADRWIYRGNDLFPFYDTQQLFLEESVAIHSIIDPWTIRGRYLPVRTWSDYVLQILNTIVLLPAVITLHAGAKVLGCSPDTLAARWRVLNRQHYRPKKFRLLSRIHTYCTQKASAHLSSLDEKKPA